MNTMAAGGPGVIVSSCELPVNVEAVSVTVTVPDFVPRK